MKVVRTNDIQIPSNRQRRVFDERSLEELADSIASRGLLHPVVVRLTEQGNLVLVAGERRLRALKLLAEKGRDFRCDGQHINVDYCPTLLLDELDPLGYEEAELDENIRRTDLSIAELALAYQRLHRLRGSQAASTGAQHTVADLAREILGPEGNPGSLSNEQTKAGKLLTIALHLDSPAVAKAKSISEAMREVERKVQAETFITSARTAVAAATPHTLLRGDTYDLVPTLPSASFDCLISDPPWGVGADTFGDQAGAIHTYSDTEADADRAYNLLATEGYRLCRPSAHAFVFCDIRKFYPTSLTFSLAGWSVWETPLIWAKSGGMLPRPGMGPRRAYEAIIFCTKGEKRVQQTVDDLFAVPGVADPRRGAEKPGELFTRLLRMVALPGDRILDPFCGTGPVFEAATRLHLTATGIERDEHAQGIAMDRLAKPAGILDL